MTVTATDRLTTDEILRLNREYTFFSWSAQSKINPIVIDRAEGVYFWDPDGKRYLDFNSQLMSINIGHGNQKVADAIAEQAHKLAFAAPQFATEVRGRLGQLLAEVTPGDLNRFFFTLGGAEANENALRMARMATGRQKVMAYHRSYHGATAGAISVTSAYCGRPDIAAKSLSARIIAFQPTAEGFSLGKKWIPSTTQSVFNKSR